METLMLQHYERVCYNVEIVNTPPTQNIHRPPHGFAKRWTRHAILNPESSSTPPQPP